MNKTAKFFSTVCAAFLFVCCGACSSPDSNRQAITPTLSPTASVKEPEPSAAPLSFDLPSGFYDKPIQLSIHCTLPDADIYYTTDGSLPDTGSKHYQGAISLIDRSVAGNVLSARKDVSIGNSYVPNKRVTKGTVVRAVAVLPDGTSTEIINGTYFVGVNRKAKYGELPIISLITDPVNLFDWETGIYTTGKTYADFLAADPANASVPGWQAQGNFSNRGRDWERPVNAELLSVDGQSAFQLDFGMRIKGGASRNELQKSLRLIARKDYGSSVLSYELIPGNLRSDGSGLITSYHTFVLRNGGNDCNYAKIRDPYLELLVSHRRMDTMQFTPCVVFLDGEFWGIYTITEHYDDWYLAENYGIDRKNAVMVKCGELEEGQEGDLELFYEMYDYITGNDMQIDACYQKAASLLDLGSFLEYCAFQFYIYNEDTLFHNNNWAMWRVRETDPDAEWCDGVWRMMLYDTDFSTGLYQEGSTYGVNNLLPFLTEAKKEQEERLSERHPLELLLSLLQNDDFRKSFILTMCDMRNTDFCPDIALPLLDTVSQPYRIAASESIQRFGPDWVVLWNDPETYYDARLKDIATFLTGRYRVFPTLLQETFDLHTPVTVALSVSDADAGAIRLNDNTILDSSLSFTGAYFPDYSITLTAIAQEGYRFVRWEASGCHLRDATAETILFQPEDGCNVTAVFSRITE